MNGIDELAAFIVRLRPDDVAVPVVEKLRLHVADTIGAWIAGTQTPEGRLVVAHRSRTLFSRGDLSAAIATHSALARLSEIDDIHLSSMITPGAIVIPSALILSAVLPDISVDDTAAAIIAGYEAMIRFGRAIDGPHILYRGIWPTYFAAGLGVAAVAARLLRLDETQAVHALALAVTMAAPSVGQQHGPTAARWLLVGNAARNGLVASVAAQAGFTGDRDVLRSRLLPDIYGIEPELSALAPSMDEPELARVSFKPWCAARQTMAAVQALRELLETGLAASEIVKVEAFVLPAHLKMIDHGVTAESRASFLTSLPYQLAIVALHPGDMIKLDAGASLHSPAVQALMARVTVRGDDTLSADYPAIWPAHIVVTLASGSIKRTVSAIPGDPARAFSKEDVGRKFQALLAPLLGAGTAELWRSSMRVLDSRQSLTSILERVESFASVDRV